MMTPTPIFIYGAGGHGKTLADLLRALPDYDLLGFVDDTRPPGAQVMGLPILGGAEALPGLRARGVTRAVNGVGGIGHVELRLLIFDRLAEAGFTCPAVVHPRAVVDSSAWLDEGVQLLALSYVGAESRVGFGSVLNAGAIVTHDCTLGRVVNLSPGAALAGGVTLADYAQVGMNATINMNVTIGTRARVGNGATVKADVPPEGVVYAGTIWPPRPAA